MTPTNQDTPQEGGLRQMSPGLVGGPRFYYPDWDTLFEEHPDLECLYYGQGEAAIGRIYKLFARTGKLGDVLETPPVFRYEFEFPLPKGRADLVCFHSDGSISVVEFKHSSEIKEICYGIGQVCMYAVQLGYSRTHTVIRKFLVASVVGKSAEALLIDNACSMAGVTFIPLGTLREHQESVISDLVSRGLLKLKEDEQANGATA